MLDKTRLESRHRILFEYFAFRSLQVLKQRALALNRVDLAQKMGNLLSENSSSLSDHIVRVNAFFQADSFRGFAVGLKSPTEPAEFEVFFQPAPKEALVNISNSSYEKLLQSIISLQVSTDYNTREQQFRSNYASVMDKHAQPVLVMELDPLKQDVQLGIKLFDPSGE